MDGFDVYSKYGSNHEQAQRVLREMLQDQKILAFFSASSYACDQFYKYMVVKEEAIVGLMGVKCGAFPSQFLLHL